MPFVVTEERLIQSYNQLLIQSDRSDVLINKKDFRILVNVGWISRELMDKINCSKDDQNRNKLVKKVVNSNIEMVGVIRKTEKVFIDNGFIFCNNFYFNYVERTFCSKK